MNDQADSLRRSVLASAPAQAPARARTIAVTSGKGGVGKTNLAVNLAIAAARRRRRTILVDADYGLANADLILDVDPRWNLSHVLAGEVDPREALVEGPEGVRLLAGASGIRRLADLDGEGREAAARAFASLAGDADLLIIDTGAGIARNVIATAAAADEILVATCPEPPAIADAYAVVKSIAAEGDGGR
ncbi:MAG: AAA family ATPase, partial [Planctomycetes bacterium]|nr:AAA family ATPase [Planctomycetota bacterium]